MPNIASLLKEEIGRLARKEIRSSTEAIKKASAQHRRDIAALKRQVTALEKTVANLQNAAATTETPARDDDANKVSIRFTAKGLRSQRKRLKLSATEYAKLLGVTPQSIYNWERGVARPRPAQLKQLAELRGIGKKQATARLAQLVE